MDNSEKIQELELLKRWAFQKYSTMLKSKSVSIERTREILGYKDDRYVRKLVQEGWLERYSKGKIRIARVMTISIIAFMKLRMKEDGVSSYLADDEIEATLVSHGLI